MNKQVIMKIQFEVFLRNEVKTSDFGCDIGGYAFYIDGKSIPFDFNALSGNNFQKGNTIVVDCTSGAGPAFNEYDIDNECYNDIYEELGLTAADITAEFLSKVERLGEVYIAPRTANGPNDGYIDPKDYVVRINEIKFYDENRKEYSVSEEVIVDFNATEIINKGKLAHRADVAEYIVGLNIPEFCDQNYLRDRDEIIHAETQEEAIGLWVKNHNGFIKPDEIKYVIAQPKTGNKHSIE